MEKQLIEAIELLIMLKDTMKKQSRHFGEISEQMDKRLARFQIRNGSFLKSSDNEDAFKWMQQYMRNRPTKAMLSGMNKAVIHMNRQIVLHHNTIMLLFSSDTLDTDQLRKSFNVIRDMMKCVTPTA